MESPSNDIKQKKIKNKCLNLTFKCNNITLLVVPREVQPKYLGFISFFGKKSTQKNGLKCLMTLKRKSTEDYLLSVLNTYSFYKVLYKLVKQCLL